MSNYSQHQVPQAYPAVAPAQQGPYVTAPPVGYPMSANSADYPTQERAKTQSRGDGFLKGCCAALCCCCLLDACF